MRRVTASVLLLTVIVLTACASKKESIPGAPNIDTGSKLAPGELPGDIEIKNPEVAYNMALEFAGQNNMDAAQHYIDLAMKLQPNAKYSYTKALFLLTAKKYQDALGFLDQALKLGPGTEDNKLSVWNAEGICYMQLNRDEEALDVFRKVVNTPGLYSRFESYYNMGVIYLRQKRYLDAEADFRKVVDENPQYYRAYNKLGILAAYKGDWAGAALSYKKALDLIANDYGAQQADGAEIYYNYGEALYNEKLYPEARNALLQVLKISPESTYGQKAKTILAQIGG
jgi:tetratricopeptide (TPR) repeat protein